MCRTYSGSALIQRNGVPENADMLAPLGKRESGAGKYTDGPEKGGVSERSERDALGTLLNGVPAIEEQEVCPIRCMAMLIRILSRWESRLPNANEVDSDVPAESILEPCCLFQIAIRFEHLVSKRSIIISVQGRFSALQTSTSKLMRLTHTCSSLPDPSNPTFSSIPARARAV